MEPTPAPTAWIDGFSTTKHAERCVGNYWEPGEPAPAIIAQAVNFVIFAAVGCAFERMVVLTKRGKDGTAMFLPPPVLILINRYIIFQMMFQSAFTVALFFVFIVAGNPEVSCYIQYYRRSDVFYGNVGGFIALMLMVYFHVMVNWIIRPIVGKKIAKVLGQYFVTNAALEESRQTQVVFVGCLDGFHATKVAGALKEAAEGKFISKRHLYRTAGIDVYSSSAAISPKVRPKWKYI